MSYTETLALLAVSTETAVVDLHARFEAGEFTEEVFVALAVAALVQADARGTGLADLALATTLSAQQGQPVPTVGLAPTGNPGRLRTAVLAALSAAVAAEALGVTARAETLASAQDAYARGMRAHEVAYWTRVLNGGACELCQDLAGDVLPASADMYHHKGCGCTQRPIKKGEAA